MRDLVRVQAKLVSVKEAIVRVNLPHSHQISSFLIYGAYCLVGVGLSQKRDKEVRRVKEAARREDAPDWVTHSYCV